MKNSSPAPTATRQEVFKNLVDKLCSIDWLTQFTPELRKEVMHNPEVIFELKKEGYWGNGDTGSLSINNIYPMPIENTMTKDEVQSFVEKLDVVEGDIQSKIAKEKKLTNAFHMSFMGISPCRCCGKSNGTGEYFFQGRSWPTGFRHYIVDHKVKPSPEFIEFIEKYSDYVLNARSELSVKEKKALRKMKK